MGKSNEEIFTRLLIDFPNWAYPFFVVGKPIFSRGQAQFSSRAGPISLVGSPNFLETHSHSLVYWESTRAKSLRGRSAEAHSSGKF